MASSHRARPPGGLPSPGFFTSLARSYASQTGNTTADLFAKAIPHIQRRLPITRDSVVHDNAAGPGTAAAVLLLPESSPYLPPSPPMTATVPDHRRRGTNTDPGPALPPGRMYVTDINPAMVDAARTTFDTAAKEGRCGCAITYDVSDSIDLDTPSNACPATGSLSHSILNFSIFTLSDPVAGVREMYRTLRPHVSNSSFSSSPSSSYSNTGGGLAVLTSWRRFAVASIIHRAQALIRPDLPPMKIPRPEFMREGELERVAVEAGFSPARIELEVEDLLVREGTEEFAGLRSFMLGDFTKGAREGWSDQDVARWPRALERALREELARYGGIKFEAWILLAQK